MRGSFRIYNEHFLVTVWLIVVWLKRNPDLKVQIPYLCSSLSLHKSYNDKIWPHQIVTVMTAPLQQQHWSSAPAAACSPRRCPDAGGSPHSAWWACCSERTGGWRRCCAHPTAPVIWRAQFKFVPALILGLDSQTKYFPRICNLWVTLLVMSRLVCLRRSCAGMEKRFGVPPLSVHWY